MATAKKTAATKQPGKALVNWEAQFADMAKDSMKGIDLPTAKWLSIKSGVLSYGGAEIPDNELRCIIVGYTFENQLYEGRYDPSNPSGPVCYAFGQDGKDFSDMAPHEKAPEPKNPDCASCPLNEYESDPAGGRGKACKNVVRLALISESDLENLDTAEIVYLKVPVTSIKNFKFYMAKTLKQELKRPAWAVLTLLSVEPDDNNAVSVNFSFVEKLEDNEYFSDASFESLKEMFDNTQESIGFPYPEAVERTKPAPKGKGKAAPKAAAAKPSKFAGRR